jgi:hypothetical protein
VKKSKLTLVKEENAELKERVARLERQLAGIQPATLSSPSSPEDVKYPPSTLLSQIQLTDSGEEDEQEYDQEDETNVETHDEPSVSGPYQTPLEEYPGPPQQHQSHFVNCPVPAQHFPNGARSTACSADSVFSATTRVVWAFRGRTCVPTTSWTARLRIPSG